MFKKIVAVVLVIALTAAASIAGTMAYLQDDDSDVNVMTLGNVKIAQHEYQRATNEDGTYKTDTIDNQTSYVLEPFVQAKPLYPFVGEVDNGYDSIPVRLSQLGHNSRGGMEMLPAKNVQDKFVVVENTGKSDAYVRTIVAFEAGSVVEEDWYKLVSYSSHFTWKETQDWFVTEINGNNYYMVEFIYNGYQDVQHPNGVLTPGDYTYNSLAQVYMFDTATNEDVVALDGNNNGTFDILVLSQAVQTNGFADAKTALDTAFGEFNTTNVVDWFDGAEFKAPTLVATAEELVDTLNSGKSAVLTSDLELEDQPIVITGNATLDLGGHTIEARSTSAKASNLITVNAGADLTIKGGTVTFIANAPDTDWGAEGFPGYANNTINNKGTLIIDGATIENKTAAGGASYAIDNYNGANLIIESGKVVQSGGDVAIRMFGGTTNVTINGGEISGKRAVWIQLPSSNAAQAPDMNLTVNGGTLTGTQMAIYSYSYGNSFADVDVVITGGTFNGDVAFGGGYKGNQENVTVTGGTFNDELGRYLENDGWADIAKP